MRQGAAQSVCRSAGAGCPRRGMARRGMARRGMARRGMARCRPACRGMARQGLARRGVGRCRAARREMGRCRLARRGLARRGQRGLGRWAGQRGAGQLGQDACQAGVVRRGWQAGWAEASGVQPGPPGGAIHPDHQNGLLLAHVVAVLAQGAGRGLPNLLGVGLLGAGAAGPGDQDGGAVVLID
jgi:hypothetical protein